MTDDDKNVLSRLHCLELNLGILDQRMSDHLKEADGAWKHNDEMHHKIIVKLEESLRWQTRVKIIIGTVATILGGVFMIIYHYAPWIWDALPKHGHTH